MSEASRRQRLLALPARALARIPLAAALAAILALVYWPTLSAGFVYDDFLHVVAEPIPESARQIARIFAEPMSPLVPYYRPLPRLLNVAQKALFGAAPLPFHALNVALGIACALAFRALLRSRAIGAPDGTAFVGALIFAVHPLAAECIAPIASGRETLLPTLFTLLALAGYFRATRSGRALALACFALGLLSQERAIVTPILLACADALRIAPETPRDVRAWLARYAPYGFVAAAYGFARHLAVPGALSPELALFAQPGGPILSLLYDLQTTFAPFARVVYEPRVAVWWSLPRLAVAAAAAGALLFAAARADTKRALWWLAVVAFSLAPTANVFVQEPGFAERWGFAALAGWVGLYALARAHCGMPRARRLLDIAVAVACIAVSSLRAPAYRDDAAFLAQWLRSDPASRQAWISSGEAHERRGEWAEAIAAYRHVLVLAPGTPLAHASLAIAFAAQGQLALAQSHAERAVALDPRDAESWSNLGGIRARRGDLVGAIAHYERALSLRPRLATAHNNLALALRQRGDLAAARIHLEAALATNPQYAEAHANLGDLLAAQGDRANAERHLRRALELAPALTPARAALQRLEAPRP